MQASQSPCTLPSQWPSTAFLTYLHMELWELCFNSLFHLHSVYIMWAYFFKKEKKRPRPVTCMTMMPNHEKIHWFFSPLILCWLLIEKHSLHDTANIMIIKLHYFIAFCCDYQIWVTKLATVYTFQVNREVKRHSPWSHYTANKHHNYSVGIAEIIFFLNRFS